MVFSWLEYFLLIGRLLLSLEFLCGLQIFILSLSCVIPVPCVTGCANSHIFMNCRWIEPRGLRSTLGHFRCCGRRIHRILQRAQEGFLPMHPQKLFHSSLSIYPTHQIISMSYTLQNKSHAPKHISFYRSVSLSMLVLRLLAIFGRGD